MSFFFLLAKMTPAPCSAARFQDTWVALAHAVQLRNRHDVFLHGNTMLRILHDEQRRTARVWCLPHRAEHRAYRAMEEDVLKVLQGVDVPVQIDVSPPLLHRRRARLKPFHVLAFSVFLYSAAMTYWYLMRTASTPSAPLVRTNTTRDALRLARP